MQGMENNSVGTASRPVKEIIRGAERNKGGKRRDGPGARNPEPSCVRRAAERPVWMSGKRRALSESRLHEALSGLARGTVPFAAAQPDAGSVFRRKPFRFLPPRGSGRLRIGERAGFGAGAPSDTFRTPRGADGLGLRCIAALLGVGIDGADLGDLVLGGSRCRPCPAP